MDCFTRAYLQILIEQHKMSEKCEYRNKVLAEQIAFAKDSNYDDFKLSSGKGFSCSDNQDDAMKIYLASNKTTSINTLARLAKDENHEVRIAVAKNHNTPISILAWLVNDKSSDVIAAVKKYHAGVYFKLTGHH